MTDTFDRRHPHERDEWEVNPIPVVLRPDGGCAVCGLMYSVDEAQAESRALGVRLVEAERQREWWETETARVQALAEGALNERGALRDQVEALLAQRDERTARALEVAAHNVELAAENSRLQDNIDYFGTDRDNALNERDKMKADFDAVMIAGSKRSQELASWRGRAVEAEQRLADVRRLREEAEASRVGMVSLLDLDRVLAAAGPVEPVPPPDASGGRSESTSAEGAGSQPGDGSLSDAASVPLPDTPREAT